METWPAPEDADGRLPGGEVVVAALGVLAGGDAREHVLVPDLEVQPEGLHAALLEGAEPGEVGRRLDLHLHGQAAGVADRLGAAGHVGGAAVVAVGGAGGERHVLGAVEPGGRLGHLGEQGRRLHRHGAARSGGSSRSRRSGTARACPSRRSAGRPSRRGCRGASGRSSSRAPRRPSRGRRSWAAGACARDRPRPRRASACRPGPSRRAPARRATRRRSRRARAR